MPIAVFDSGVGGISVLRELEKSKDKLTVEQIIENVKTEMNSDAENFEREHKK